LNFRRYNGRILQRQGSYFIVIIIWKMKKLLRIPIIIIVWLTRDYRLLEVFINYNTVVISCITGSVLRPKFCKTCIFMYSILLSIQFEPGAKKKPIKRFFSSFVHINSIFSCSKGLECSRKDQTLNETVYELENLYTSSTHEKQSLLRGRP